MVTFCKPHAIMDPSDDVVKLSETGLMDVSKHATGSWRAMKTRSGQTPTEETLRGPQTRERASQYNTSKLRRAETSDLLH